MPRVKRGTKRRAKRKKILERASGYFLTKSKLYRSAKEAVERGLKFAYSGRKQKKRQCRSPERIKLQPVHQRVEKSRGRIRPQDTRGFGGTRPSWIWQSGGAGEESERCRRYRVASGYQLSAVSFQFSTPSYFHYHPGRAGASRSEFPRSRKPLSPRIC